MNISNIPSLACPKCHLKMFMHVRYDPVIKLLKDRDYVVCGNCGFSKETEQLKDMIFTR